MKDSPYISRSTNPLNGCFNGILGCGSEIGNGVKSFVCLPY